jgi:hypothetical protein
MTIMKNYETMRGLCEKNSRISGKVVDGYLISFAAGHHNLEQKMDKQFAVYRHVTRKFEKEWIGIMKSQFIAHRIFRKEGLIGTFLNHPALNLFNREELDYLNQQAKQPWRFSFSVIIKEPERDFFLMEDVFTRNDADSTVPASHSLVPSDWV